MRALLTLAIVVLAGCAGFATREGLEQLLRSWEGSDVNELITSWGPPTRTDELPNGSKMYTYVRSGNYTTPTYVTPVRTTPSHTTVNVYGNTAYATTTPGVTTGGQVFGGQTYSMYCSVSFTTDRSSRIVTWRYEGNACTAVPQSQPSSKATYIPEAPADVQPLVAPQRACQVDSDCADGKSCRSTKGGGTECRPKSTSQIKGNEGQIPINWKGISPAQSKGQVSILFV